MVCLQFQMFDRVIKLGCMVFNSLLVVMIDYSWWALSTNTKQSSFLLTANVITNCHYMSKEINLIRWSEINQDPRAIWIEYNLLERSSFSIKAFIQAKILSN